MTSARDDLDDLPMARCKRCGDDFPECMLTDGLCPDCVF